MSCILNYDTKIRDFSHLKTNQTWFCFIFLSDLLQINSCKQNLDHYFHDTLLAV